MALQDMRVPGLPRKTNTILKNAPYAFVSPESVTSPGLLVVLATGNDSGKMKVASAGGPVDGVVTTGSKDTASGIWNVAYTGNIDAIDVLTDEDITAGSEIYVGADGKATAVTPSTDYYVIGVSGGNTGTTTLCDGSIAKVVPVYFEKVRSKVVVASPAQVQSKRSNFNQGE